MNTTSQPEITALIAQVSLRTATDEALLSLSRDKMLSLSLEEMKAVQSYFGQIGRDPTDAELETIAQTWSEHCVHKTLKGLITYEETGPGAKTRVYDNLLKETIMRVTQELKATWCLSVFADNAGIIELDSE